MTAGAIQLFYSYADEESDFLNQFDTHLAPLKRDGLIQTWYNQKIQAGSVRGKESAAHLQAAQIILLLLSPQYLASDSCYEGEAKPVLAKQQAGTAHVLPMIVRPCG